MSFTGTVVSTFLAFRMVKVQYATVNPGMTRVELIFRILVAAAFGALAVHVFHVGDWHWRATYTHPHGVHIVGWPKDLLALALCCASASLLSLVVLHYHQRGETIYRCFARFFSIAGWTLLAASFVIYAYQYPIR